MLAINLYVSLKKKLSKIEIQYINIQPDRMRTNEQQKLNNNNISNNIHMIFVSNNIYQQFLFARIESTNDLFFKRSNTNNINILILFLIVSEPCTYVKFIDFFFSLSSSLFNKLNDKILTYLFIMKWKEFAFIVSRSATAGYQQ